MAIFLRFHKGGQNILIPKIIKMFTPIFEINTIMPIIKHIRYNSASLV